MEQLRTRSVSRQSQIRIQRQPSANVVVRARKAIASERPSERSSSVVAEHRRPTQSGGRPSAYAREIQGRSAWGVRPAAATARIVKREGPLQAPRMRVLPGQCNFRVAAFVRVTHTVAYMNARIESNGYGTVSSHARPNSYAPQREV